MSKITFSKTSDGYSPKEVDTYIDMLEQELSKAVLLDNEKSSKLTELENNVMDLTVENSQLKEKSNLLELEMSKICEEKDDLQKQLDNKDQYAGNSYQTSDENLESLIGVIHSLARANELLAEHKAKNTSSVYRSASSVDEIVDRVLSEGKNISPKFDL